MADDKNDEPPYVGGSQPVKQKADPLPSGGRGVLQTAILALAAIAVLAAIAWVAVPMLAAG